MIVLPAGHNPWAVTLGQLARAAASTSQLPPKFNPRPPGTIEFASGTHAVLLELGERRGRWTDRAALIEGTGCSRKAVDWALRFLERLGVLEVQRRTPAEVFGYAGNTRSSLIRYRLNDAAEVLVTAPAVRRLTAGERAAAFLAAQANVMEQ